MFGTAKPSFPSPPHGPLADGLVGCWPFYDGSGPTVNDVSGYGNNGLLNGGVTWAGGTFGWSLDFDGSSGYVQTAENPALSLGAPFTLACWFNTSNAVTSQLMGVWGSTSATQYYTLGLTNNHVAITTYNGFYAGPTGNTSLAAGTWYFVVGVWTGNSLIVYLNATQDGITSGGGGWNHSGSPCPFRIGAAGDTTVQTPFAGIIDGPMVFDRALSPAEIADLYADSWQIVRRSRTVLARTLTRTLSAYRWRNDDGSESTATWQAAEDIDVTDPQSTNFRLRTQVAVTSTPPTESVKLQYKQVGATGDWQDVEIEP